MLTPEQLGEAVERAALAHRTVRHAHLTDYTTSHEDLAARKQQRLVALGEAMQVLFEHLADVLEGRPSAD
jgi:hypothetical protein